MDWKLLVGKGVFGLMILAAWGLGLLTNDVVIGTILALISINDLGNGYGLYKASLKKRGRK